MERNRQRAKGRGDYAAPQRNQQQQKQQQSYHQASLQQQQQQSYYFAQRQQRQQHQNYYSQQYLAPTAAGYHPRQPQALGGYPQQAPQYYYQPQAQRRRPADPPAPVQHSESVAGSSDGIQLSERQLELLAKRNRRASPQRTYRDEAQSLQQQREQESSKPFQTRSNISQGSIQSIDGVATTVIPPTTQQASKPDEGQRKLLRSMLSGRKDNSASGSFNDDPGKVLLKKFLNQQKTRVGKGSNLSEQLRERLFQKRSTESANSPKKTLSTKTKREDLQVQTSMASSSQVSERVSSTALSQPKPSPVPSAPSSQSASLPSAPKMSENYRQFLNKLQREVSSSHSLLFASFEKSVGFEGIPQRSPTVSKLDEQTVEQIRVLQAVLKSKYEPSIVECRKVTQMVNDKKYTKEKRALAKKGTKKKTATRHNLLENDKVEDRKPTIEPGIAATEKSYDVERITDHPVTAPEVGTSTAAASSNAFDPSENQPQEKRELSKPKYVEKNGIIHVDYQDLPSFSEDPILQTRSSGSVSSSTGSRRPNLQVAIPASKEDSGNMDMGTDSTRTASRKVATGTEQKKSLPPPGTSPIPWVGVQLRSVSEARDAEENRVEKAPSWASVNLRQVTQKNQDSNRGQNLRVGSAADSPIVVDSDSQSGRNDFPPCCPSEVASSCITGPQQAPRDECEEAKCFSTDKTEIDVSNVEPEDDESPKLITQPKDEPKPSTNLQDERPVDDDVVVIRLNSDGANDKDEHRVIIGKKMVRRITNNPGGSNAVVCWNLPREDMEHDGMTLNMPTLKVTLLLKKGKGSCKVLSFQNAADCLRFATAFYNMTGLDSAPDKSVPPISEISDTASDVNSSVRLESLNDEEQNVLERYRELRQTNSATDALNETISQSTQSRAGTTMSVAASPEEEELLKKYRKMLKLGMPLGAVQHKMKLDNVPPQIQKAVTEDSGKNAPPPSFVDALPTSPVSTFTATTVGDGEKLTEEEEKVAESYRLLLKRGLPPDAVRHKLARDNVDIKIVHAVFGGSGAAAVATTSTADVPQPPAGPSLSEAENIIAEKYRKMLKMRIPAEAVRHKMTQDQVDAKIVAAVLSEGKPALAPKVEESKGKTTAKTSAKALSEEEESIASQYRKLLKLQIPREAVLSRMEKEGVSEKIITAVVGPRALGSKPSNDASTATGSASSNLINLHWNAMEDVPAGSVWEETSKKSTEPERSDITTLVALFQKKKPSTIREEKKKADAGGRNSKARLLDLTRSNNLAISLKAFKDFSHQELADIIGFLDPTRKIRGERAQFIRDLLPTAPEMKIISEYSGSDERLVPAELWLRHLRGIKRLETKAQVLRTMEMFTSEIKAVESNFHLLNEVCHQVMGSVKLQDLLGMVLRIGNVMNEGTRTGGAAGFRFDSLLRLTQTKTSDGKITVLDYLVTVFVAKGQRDTLDLESDFPECHTASRLLISDMTNEVKLLKESLEQCRNELKDLERDQAPPPKKVSGSATSAGDDPRGQLFASILSRANSNDNEDLPPRPPGPRGDVFAKRDAFLAAIAPPPAPKAPSSPLPKSKKSPEKVEPEIENTLAGGTTRLRNFIANVEESITQLEKKRTETLEACKDLSKYCGETGGVGSTIMLLGVLSEFAKSIESALKKYDQQQESHVRKQKSQETREGRTTSSADASQAVDKAEKKPSLILLVSDVLKNANPQFKDDFKKGRTLPNPSKPLKEIYKREASATRLTQKLDIVSAIREREGEINEDDGLQQHARTTFAGARRYSVDMKKTDEAEIGETSEPFVSVKDRASFLTAAHRSQSAAPDKKLAVTNPQPATDSAPVKKLAVTKPQAATDAKQTLPVVPEAKETTSSADRKPIVEQDSPRIVSSSPPITNNGHAEYRTRTPPLPTGKPLPPSLPSSGSGSKPTERKSIYDRARERRLEKKSAARSASTDRRSTISGPSTTTESQTSSAQSARKNRLQRMSK